MPTEISFVPMASAGSDAVAFIESLSHHVRHLRVPALQVVALEHRNRRDDPVMKAPPDQAPSASYDPTQDGKTQLAAALALCHLVVGPEAERPSVQRSVRSQASGTDPRLIDRDRPKVGLVDLSIEPGGTKS